jgi:hypothetical protein
MKERVLVESKLKKKTLPRLKLQKNFSDFWVIQPNIPIKDLSKNKKKC